MLESAWLFVGLVAGTVTAIGVLTTDGAVAEVSGAAGIVAWLIWTYGAFDVRVVGDATTYTFNMPAIAMFGLAMALVPAWLLLDGVIGMAERYRNPDADEL